MNHLIEIRVLRLGTCEQKENTYYASGDRKKGPPEVIPAVTESYTDTMLKLDEVTAWGLGG